MINAVRFFGGCLPVAGRSFSGSRKPLDEENIKEITDLLKNSLKEANKKINKNPEIYFYDYIEANNERLRDGQKPTKQTSNVLARKPSHPLHNLHIWRSF